MKNARNDLPKQRSQQVNNNHRPEVRDNLDSRKNLELNDAPAGHNKKEVHDGEKNEHNETRGGKPKR